MTTDERPGSLASQAAAWIPPWERHAAPDDAYAAAAPEPDVSDDPGLPTSPEDRDAVPPELPPVPGESQGAVTVDAPTPLPGEEQPEPTDVGMPPDAPVAFAGAGDEAVPPPRRRGGRSPSPLPTATLVEHADLPEMGDAELRAALEAILLVVDEPVGEMQLAQIVEQPAERITALLQEVSAAYTAAGHGFDLRRAAGGWRLYTREEYAPYVERYVVDGQSVRLTQAALETLAVIAYKQPVSRSRISVIRGVNCDGVMRTLVTRGLVCECGTEPETGAILYRTTSLFLEKLGLDSVDQLPPLAPFLPDDVEEVLDAQR